jgi:hypothetical protein
MQRPLARQCLSKLLTGRSHCSDFVCRALFESSAKRPKGTASRTFCMSCRYRPSRSVAFHEFGGLPANLYVVPYSAPFARAVLPCFLFSFVREAPRSLPIFQVRSSRSAFAFPNRGDENAILGPRNPRFWNISALPPRTCRGATVISGGQIRCVWRASRLTMSQIPPRTFAV